MKFVIEIVILLAWAGGGAHGEIFSQRLSSDKKLRHREAGSEKVIKEVASLKRADVASRGVDHLLRGDVGSGIDGLVEMGKNRRANSKHSNMKGGDDADEDSDGLLSLFGEEEN
eukprot:15366884-Ditylum_brightwellii.AAC.1